MAEDVLDICFADDLLDASQRGVTVHFKRVGAEATKNGISDAPGLDPYENKAAVLLLPGAGRELGGGLTKAMVRFAARFEYARCVEEVLARRCRLLFLDAAMAQSLDHNVAGIVRQETEVDAALGAFLSLCDQYIHVPD
jgi:glycerol-3-phosphate dehydrogenase